MGGAGRGCAAQGSGLCVRSESEWAAPHPLGPSAGTEVGGAVWPRLGLFQVWEPEEILWEAGCQGPAHPGGWVEGQVWPCPLAAPALSLELRGTSWGLGGKGGADELWPPPIRCQVLALWAILLACLQQLCLGLPSEKTLTPSLHPSPRTLPQSETRPGKSSPLRPYPDVP